MIIFCFPVILLGVEVQLIGKWADTSPYEEVAAFFQVLHSDYWDKVKIVLRNHEKGSSNDILELLSSTIPEKVLDLLRISLLFRYFHPKALSQSKKGIIDKKPHLRGWGIMIPKKKSTPSIDNLASQILMNCFNLSDDESKVHFLKKISHNFAENHKQLMRFDINSTLFNQLESMPKTHHVSINGRVSKSQMHDLVNSIILEYKTMVICEKLNISDRRWLYEHPVNDIYYFTPLLANGPIFEPHDIHKLRAGWPKELKPNKDYLSFLKYHNNLVDVQVFLTFDDKKSLPLLEFAKEATLSHKPYRFHVFLVGDRNNHTQLLLMHTYHYLCDNIGTRNSIQFLIDYFKSMDFKSAYKKTHADAKWKDCKDHINNVAIAKKVNSSINYYFDKGLTEPSVSINGQFINEDPLFQYLPQYCLLEAKRIQKSMKNGFNGTTPFSDWIEKHSISLQTAFPPISINYKNMISIESYNIDEVLNALYTLHSNHSVFKELVFLFGYTICGSNYSSFEGIPPEIKSLFKIRSKIATIIGPFIFESQLTHSEVIFVLNIIKFSYSNEFQYTNLLQLHYIYLWKASMSISHVKRTSIPDLPNQFCIQNHGSGIQVVVVTNPFSQVFWDPIELSSLFFNSTIIKFVICPSSKVINKDSSIQFQYIPMNNVASAKIENNDFFIRRNSHWSLIRENDTFCVSDIVSWGVAKDDSTLIVNDQMKRTMKRTGFFAFLLPIGSHQSIGFEHDYYNADSFVPIYKTFNTFNHSQFPATNTVFNILMFMWSQESLMRSRLTIYTLVSNLTSKYLLNIIDPFQTYLPKGTNIRILPNFVPFFMAEPESILWFVKTSKYTYPGLFFSMNDKYLLFSDESVVWRKSADLFKSLDMNQISVSATILTPNKKSAAYWNPNSYIFERMGRVYHSTTVLFYNPIEWFLQNGSEEYIHMYNLRHHSHSSIGYGDEEYFNILQLRVQVLSLPEIICFCSQKNSLSNAPKALYHVKCEDKSPKYFGEKSSNLLSKASEFFQKIESGFEKTPPI